MKEQLLELLQQNARLTNAELAVMLDTTEAEVADAIRALENDGVIKGYSAIVDDELANKDMVTAIIELRVTPQRDSGYEEIAHTIMQYDEVESMYLMSGSFGGINLEDISAPRCFEIERKLKEKCDIPIFHDDQHGTAVITLAGLTNALKVVGKKKEDVKIVTSGAGAAAIAIVKLLLSSGFRNVTMCDRKGAIYAGRDGLNWIKEEMAQVTNLDKKAGSLADMLVGADVFIGVSAPGMVTKEMVQTMNKDAIIFACANPTPEIFPDEAKAGGARVVSTGRSDYPNQINNVLAFPGIFRGAFDVRASDINEEMKIAASNALANLISDEELNENYIIPAAFDPRVGPAVAKAVAGAARKSGVARI